jgi:hypothetical protein
MRLTSTASCVMTSVLMTPVTNVAVRLSSTRSVN